MTEKHENLLSNLEFRIHQLMYLCDSLKEENQKLKVQLKEKEKNLSEVYSAFEEINIKYNNLKSANVLAGIDVKDVDTTKKKLYKLVQDIDKCISLLKI